MSASMIYEIGKSLGVPVSRFFERLPGNGENDRADSPRPVEERIDFIASAEGRHLIERLVQLPPRVRVRVSTLIAAIAEELSALDTPPARSRPPIKSLDTAGDS